MAQADVLAAAPGADALPAELPVDHGFFKHLLAVSAQMTAAVAEADWLRVKSLHTEREALISHWREHAPVSGTEAADDHLAAELLSHNRELLATVARLRDEVGEQLRSLGRGARACNAYADNRDGSQHWR